jgi:spore coat protein A, manganese oxidase
MTPDMARQMVLVEVEKFAGLVQPILVNNTRWDWVEERGSSPTEIWESCNLMEAFEHLHFVEFQFVGRHGLDADAFRALYDSLFPGAPYPSAISNMGVVAARGVEARSTAHASGLGPGWPADDRYVLASPAPFGNFDAGGLLPGPHSHPARGGAGRVDDFVDADDTVPASLFGLEPADGPGYVWHCHVVCRQDSVIGCPAAAGR